MTDDKTTQGWPLPHPGNHIADDVLRLRAALTAADAASAAQAQQLADAQQAMQQMAAGKVSSVNGKSGPAVTLTAPDLGLGPADGASQMTIARDAQGRISAVQHTTAGKTATSTMGYDAQGRVHTVTTSYDGRQRTETYSYDATGKLSAMTATTT